VAAIAVNNRAEAPQMRGQIVRGYGEMGGDLNPKGTYHWYIEADCSVRSRENANEK
jgi:hypothetical protein